MSTYDSQDKKHKQYAIDFIKKGRYFSPKISTLIVLNILALASKVSAIHNWNETSSNSTVREILHKGVANQSEFSKSFNGSHQELVDSPLFHLFSDVNAYGRNKAEDILSEQQEALINEPLEGFKVLNYDELNRLIDEVIFTTTQTHAVVSIPTITNDHMTSHLNATSTYFNDPSSSSITSKVSKVQDFSTISSFYNQISDSTTRFTSSIDKTSTETIKSKLQVYTPTKTIDTPHWLLDSEAAYSGSKTTIGSQTIVVKNKPVFLRAKKLSNKNMLTDTNSTNERNSRNIGLNDIFESKGSMLKKAASMVAILTLSYLISTIYI